MFHRTVSKAIDITIACSPGDQLVSVNGMSVLAMSVEQVKAVLASISGEEIQLVVLDNTLPLKDNSTR